MFQYQNARNFGFNKNFHLKKEEASTRNDHELIDKTVLKNKVRNFFLSNLMGKKSVM